MTKVNPRIGFLRYLRAVFITRYFFGIGYLGLPNMRRSVSRGITLCCSLLLAGAVNAAVDEDLAQQTLKVNKCLKCHSIDKKKEGPAYQEVAKKYKTKHDAEKKIYTHLTTAPIVEVDGVEEEHKVIKVKNQAETYNLIRWILSQ
jgi:cytochrome c